METTKMRATIVDDVIRGYYKNNKKYGDLTVAYDAPRLLTMVEAALEAEGIETAADSLATEIEGNITTGHYKLTTDDDLLLYLFFAVMVVAVYFYFKYKIVNKQT
jgi:hypothetical protein